MKRQIVVIGGQAKILEKGPGKSAGKYFHPRVGLGNSFEGSIKRQAVQRS